MKSLKNVLTALFLSALFLSACDDEPNPSKEEKQLNKLSDTWVVSSVTYEGDDITDEYASFELTLSGSANTAVYAYGVFGRPLLSPWPSGGTWTFGSDLTTSMLRDPDTADELGMMYSVSETQLTIEFMFNGEGYDAARVGSAAGSYEFILTRK